MRLIIMGKLKIALRLGLGRHKHLLDYMTITA